MQIRIAEKNILQIFWNSHWFWLFIITFAGLILRLQFLQQMGTYWFDEMASVVIARFNFPQIWEYIMSDNHPPLGFLYLHFWIRLFGEGESVVRTSSLVWGLFSIPLTYLVGKEIFSKKTGLLASAFMSFSSFQIYYSVEARMYSMLLFFSLLSIYFYIRMLGEEKKVFWLFYTITSIFLVYTHLFGWLVIVTQNVFYFLFRRRKKTWKKLFIADCAIILIFLPWVAGKIVALEGVPISNGWYFSPIISSVSFFYLFKDLISFQHESSIISFLFDVTIIISIAFAFLSLFKQVKSKEGFEAKIFVVFWILFPLFLVSITGFTLAVSKYMIFVGPALYLIIAEGVRSADSLFGKKFFTVAILIIFFFSGSISIFFDHGKKIYYWDEVADYVSAKAHSRFEDKILISNFMDLLEFKEYYRGEVPYEGVGMFQNEENKEKMILKYNWNSPIYADYTLMGDRLTHSTEGYRRVFLVDAMPEFFDPQNWVVEWFPKNGWRLVEKKSFRFAGGAYPTKPLVWVWERIE